MTTEEQEIMIAEACGVVWCDHSSRANEYCPKCGHGMMMFPYVDSRTNKIIAGYTTDLNAMHEAEKVLTPEQRDYYAQWILSHCGTSWGVFASANERAEAFLRTLNLWKETL